jgi:tRNA A-37 threonylcarbamoyl transferase component Bud32
MHERGIYHGKLHGENVLIRDDNNEQNLCLADYAYTNLCPSHAVTLLVKSTPSLCGKEKREQQ